MKRYALVVGIGAYRSAGARSLKGAVSDARSIASLLEGDDPQARNLSPWDVWLTEADRLKDPKGPGSAENLDEDFKNWKSHLAENAGDEFDIFVYFAGHAGEPGDRLPGEVALLAADGLPWKDVGQLLSDVTALGARYTTIVLDCCSAGALISALQRFLSSGQLHPDRASRTAIFAACSPEGASYSIAADKGGEFTGLVLDGLGRDPKVHGQVTAQQLAGYLTSEWTTARLSSHVTDVQRPQSWVQASERIPLVDIDRRFAILDGPQAPSGALWSGEPVIGPYGEVELRQEGPDLRVAWVLRNGDRKPWPRFLSVQPGERALAVMAARDRSSVLILVAGDGATRLLKVRPAGDAEERPIQGLGEAVRAEFGIGRDAGTVTLNSATETLSLPLPQPSSSLSAASR